MRQHNPNEQREPDKAGGAGLIVARCRALIRTLFKGSGRRVASDQPAPRPSESDLCQLRHQASAAAQAKTDFLATVNHELRTPLNAVIGFSELLEQQVFGPLGHPRYVEYAQMIRTSGDHLLHAITEILDVSRSGAGLANLRLEPIRLDQIVARCQGLLAAQAQQAGVEVTVAHASTTPILADAARIEHALLNIMSNAVKFSWQGDEITVMTAIHAREAEIVISDTGVGMNSAELLLALEPFRQGDGSLARRHGGMGLGLPVAKRLIEMHGGMLLIDSMPGCGTSVTITLPRRPMPPQPDVSRF